jgi:uncharacterized membrane protein YcjF (UPF0283 family)
MVEDPESPITQFITEIDRPLAKAVLIALLVVALLITLLTACQSSTQWTGAIVAVSTATFSGFLSIFQDTRATMRAKEQPKTRNAAEQISTEHELSMKNAREKMKDSPTTITEL